MVRLDRNGGWKRALFQALRGKSRNRKRHHDRPRYRTGFVVTAYTFVTRPLRFCNPVALTFAVHDCETQPVGCCFTEAVDLASPFLAVPDGCAPRGRIRG